MSIRVLEMVEMYYGQEGCVLRLEGFGYGGLRQYVDDMV